MTLIRLLAIGAPFVFLAWLEISDLRAWAKKDS